MNPSAPVPNSELPSFLHDLGTTYADLEPKPGSLVHAMREVQAQKEKVA